MKFKKSILAFLFIASLYATTAVATLSCESLDPGTVICESLDTDFRDTYQWSMSGGSVSSYGFTAFLQCHQQSCTVELTVIDANGISSTSSRRIPGSYFNSF